LKALASAIFLGVLCAVVFTALTAWLGLPPASDDVAWSLWFYFAAGFAGSVAAQAVVAVVHRRRKRSR